MAQRLVDGATEITMAVRQMLLSVQYDIAAAHADKQECLSYQGGQYYTYESSFVPREEVE